MSFLLLAVIGLVTGGLAGHILIGKDRTAAAPLRAVAVTPTRRKRY